MTTAPPSRLVAGKQTESTDGLIVSGARNPTIVNGWSLVGSRIVKMAFSGWAAPLRPEVAFARNCAEHRADVGRNASSYKRQLNRDGANVE